MQTNYKRREKYYYLHPLTEVGRQFNHSAVFAFWCLPKFVFSVQEIEDWIAGVDKDVKYQ